jgi:hypothetical protein
LARRKIDDCPELVARHWVLRLLFHGGREEHWRAVELDNACVCLLGNHFSKTDAIFTSQISGQNIFPLHMSVLRLSARAQRFLTRIMANSKLVNRIAPLVLNCISKGDLGLSRLV